MNTSTSKTLFSIVIVALFITASIWLTKNFDSASSQNNPDQEVSSFKACEAAGFPIMESYPRQCRNAEGILFIEEI